MKSLLENRFVRASMLCGASAVALAASPIQASAAPAAAESVAIQEVIVTASRRSERLMDVPMAVTAVTSAQLKNAGAVTTADLSQIAPGMTAVYNGKTFQPAIRGVSSTLGGAGEEQNIAFYIDNVYMASTTGNIFSLKGMEQIEVLKGPQGTLFGRNATAGAIRVTTRDPSQIREVDASAAYGSRLKSKDYTLYVNTPITDTLAVNLSANIYDDKGYLTNLIPGWDQGKLGSNHSWLYRIKAKWTPTEDFSATLIGDQGRQQNDIIFSVAPRDGVLNALRNDPRYIANTQHYTVALNLKPVINVRTGGVSLHLEYDRPKFNLQSTSAYRTSDEYGELDTDRTNIPNGVTISSDGYIWVTQELLFASKFSGPFNFIAGGYYFHSDSDGFAGGFATGPISTPGGGTISNGTLTSNLKGYVLTNSKSAFADGTFAVTDHFKIIGGIRYTHEAKSWLGRRFLPALPELRDRTVNNNTSFRIGGQYKFNEAVNAYATYATGFKSATYNATITGSVPEKALPEYVKSIEAGLKARVTSNLDLTLSAFRYRYTDIQVAQANTTPTGLTANLLTNGGSAKMMGGEAEVTWRATPEFQLRAGGAWLPTAKYTTFVGGLDSVPKGYPGSLNPTLCPGPSCGLGNDQIIRGGPNASTFTGGPLAGQKAPPLDGTRIQRAPKFTFNLNADWQHETRLGTLNVNANYFHTSKIFRFPGEHIAQPKYDLLNATVGLWLPGDHVRLAVFGRNITNKYYIIYISPNVLGTAEVPGAPRSVGVSVEVKY